MLRFKWKAETGGDWHLRILFLGRALSLLRPRIFACEAAILLFAQCRIENHLIHRQTISKYRFHQSAKSAQHASTSQSTIVRQRCVSVGRNSAEVLWWIWIFFFFAPKITHSRQPGWCIRHAIYCDRSTIHRHIGGERLSWHAGSSSQVDFMLCLAVPNYYVNRVDMCHGDFVWRSLAADLFICVGHELVQVDHCCSKIRSCP